MSKPVASIEVSDTGKRANIYIKRESYEGRWVWVVYSKLRGQEPVDESGANRSRQQAVEAVEMLWGSGWDLQWLS
jgi:hypothetical protein